MTRSMKMFVRALALMTGFGFFLSASASALAADGGADAGTDTTADAGVPHQQAPAPIAAPTIPTSIAEPLIPPGRTTAVPPSRETVKGPDRRFGTRGTWAISGDYPVAGVRGMGFSIAHWTSDLGSVTTIQIQPTVDIFLLDRFSVGMVAGYRSERFYDLPGDTRQVITRQYSLGLRAGVVLSLGEDLSLWPRAEVLQSKATTTGLAGWDSTLVTAYVPVIAHGLAHFYVGVGPYVNVELREQVALQQNKGTGYGAAFTLGGWGGGR